MSKQLIKLYANELNNLQAAGLLKAETAILSEDSINLKIPGQDNEVINFCSNDFLGISCDKRIMETAEDALRKVGFSTTSYRYMTGTHIGHHLLEELLAKFLGYESCLIFSSHYLAAMGLFDSITNEQDTIFVDSLSNPALIDGVRLCNAKKEYYLHRDMIDLENLIKMSYNSRFLLVATDATFHIDGSLAKLDRIRTLCKKYDCLSVVDDSFGIGVVEHLEKGQLSPKDRRHRPDILCGSFGFALGCISGGYIAGKKGIIDWMRQSNRSYTQSSPLSPLHAMILVKILETLQEDDSLFIKLVENVNYIKERLSIGGLNITNNAHPVLNVLIGDAVKTQRIVDEMLRRGFLISGLCYPSVPQGTARLKIQVTAIHSNEQLESFCSNLLEVYEEHMT